MIIRILNTRFAVITVFIGAAVLCSLGCGRDDPAPVEPEPDLGFPRYDFDNPAWSPNDDFILFSYHTNPLKYPDTLGMYRFDLVDSSYTRLLPGDMSCPDYPDFSPDRRHIVLTWHDQVCTATVDGDSLTQLTFEGRNFEPAWSPDGGRIAYFRLLSGLHIVNVDGSNDYLLLKGELPQWIDSTHLAYTRMLDGIFIYDLQTDEAEQVFWLDEGWSEIGNLKYCEVTSTFLMGVNEREITQPNLFRVDLDGSNLMRLTSR